MEKAGNDAGTEMKYSGSQDPRIILNVPDGTGPDTCYTIDRKALGFYFGGDHVGLTAGSGRGVRF